MKITWLKNSNQSEDLIISYQEKTSQVKGLMAYLDDKKILVESKDQEHLLQLDQVIFFETNNREIYAHTVNKAYRIRKRLYELEEVLPKTFIRASKASIINLHQVSSLEKNITSGRMIEFYNTHKITYVSRLYFPKIKHALRERSLL